MHSMMLREIFRRVKRYSTPRLRRMASSTARFVINCETASGKEVERSGWVRQSHYIAPHGTSTGILFPTSFGPRGIGFLGADLFVAERSHSTTYKLAPISQPPRATP